ncbi:MAG: zinc-ribbon domain containing protein [Candidatus Baltobacteraceae bacterium]
MYADETLTCTDCGAAFVFSAGEQEFFASKGFQNKPNRCPDCRSVRKAARGAGGGAGSGGSGGAARAMFAVTCSSCGRPAEVPFQPRGDKPVYCRDCFSRQRSPSR